MASVATKTATLALLGGASLWIAQLVRAYGWDGALRYIWEGDANPLHIREYVHTLDEALRVLDRSELKIAAIEEALERARLDSVDDDAAAVLLLWKRNLPKAKRDLRRDLALLSYDMDQAASKIDQVAAEEEVRQRKKQLSKRVVKLMARVDVLIEFFKKATSPSE